MSLAPLINLSMSSSLLLKPYPPIFNSPISINSYARISESVQYENLVLKNNISLCAQPFSCFAFQDSLNSHNSNMSKLNSKCSFFKTNVNSFDAFCSPKMSNSQLKRNTTLIMATDNSGNDGNGGNKGNGGGDDDNDKPFEGDSPKESFISVIWGGYLNSLGKKPVLTKAITSMLLSMFGDLFCQIFIEKSNQIDLKRLIVISAIGFLLVGPTLHFWYSSLGQIIKTQGTVGALLRLFLDQFIFSPLFICAFFSSLLTLEGRPNEIIPKLKQDWLTTTVTNWKVWIPFQFLNFRFVPLQLQVATANLIALVWNVYLSFSSHTAVKS